MLLQALRKHTERDSELMANWMIQNIKIKGKILVEYADTVNKGSI